MKPIDLLIVGAGNRGQRYAQIAEQFPEQLRIVGVAEPRDWQRNHLARRHHLPPRQLFRSWEEAAAVPKFADAAVIATQDRLHVEPAMAFADLQYHLLLEKPIAIDETGCRQVIESIRKNGVIGAVCHILRCTRYTQEMKRLLNTGKIGEIVTLQHIVPVGYWHQAHSFVRGNWRKAEEASPILLQKACHDLDLIRYLINDRCKQVSSFGLLTHFTEKHRPTGAAERCITCPPSIETTCPYSAKRIYYHFYNHQNHGPVAILTPEPSPENLEAALKEGPYGRCVYACDNDVVDHQTVIMNFEHGAVASFLMTGFSPTENRHTAIHGTRGTLEGDGTLLTHYDFLTGSKTVLDTTKDADPILDAPFGGANTRLLLNFAEAVRHHDPKLIIAPLEDSLETFLTVFTAEHARLSHTVETLPENPI